MIPGGYATHGNVVAKSSSQRWAIPGFNSGNGVDTRAARADSGLRRNRGPKTRKGRERNLEPDLNHPSGGAEGKGTERGELSYQPPGWWIR